MVKSKVDCTAVSQRMVSTDMTGWQPFSNQLCDGRFDLKSRQPLRPSKCHDDITPDLHCRISVPRNLYCRQIQVHCNPISRANQKARCALGLIQAQLANRGHDDVVPLSRRFRHCQLNKKLSKNDLLWSWMLNDFQGVYVAARSYWLTSLSPR
jgi:hypothetical protein